MEPPATWQRWAGNRLQFTPDPADPIRRSLKVEIYQYQLSDTAPGQPPPQPPPPPPGTKPIERYAFGFSGGVAYEKRTPRPNERGVWRSVSGVGRVVVRMGEVPKAEGGGRIAAIYVRNGKVSLRVARFFIEAADALPNFGGTPELRLKGRITSSTFDECPKSGDSVELWLTRGAGPVLVTTGKIAAFAGSCFREGLPALGFANSVAVSIQRIGFG